MSSSKPRRHFTPPQKAEIVRRHLSGKESVSNLADEFGLQPSLIHLWVKAVLDQAEKVFERTPGGRISKRVQDAMDDKIARLEATVIKKNEVIVELMQEHVQLKKELGEL